MPVKSTKTTSTRKPVQAKPNVRQVRRQQSSDSEQSEESGEKHRRYGLDDSAAFQIAYTEGNTLRTSGQYRKAINAYSRALQLQPNHKNCLLARSACYQQVGENNRALADSNKTLDDGSKYIKGLLQKADVYYQMGEFEYALVYFHRGHKIRPEIQAFRLGIQKSQEAIENSIGEKADIKLTKQGDLSFFTEEQKPDASRRREVALTKSSTKADRQMMKRTSRHEDRKKIDSKTVQQLLGDLYTDKEYLENLLNETENQSKSKTKDQVIELTTDCLEYLNSRTEFWQQQEPAYSRGKKSPDGEAKDKQQRRSSSHLSFERNPSQWIIANLKIIDREISEGKYEAAYKHSKETLDNIETLDKDRLTELQTLVATLHSLAGNAAFEQGKDHYELSLKHHQKDHEISTQEDFPDGVSRAKDNIGRLYIRMAEYKKAMTIFKEKVPLSTTALEKAWLFHEIGRCHLELGEAEESKEFGESSFDNANEAGGKEGSVWQLNARILIAQSEVKMEKYNDALESFEAAERLATSLKDKPAEKAVRKAIRDVKKTIECQ